MALIESAPFMQVGNGIYDVCYYKIKNTDMFPTSLKENKVKSSG